MNLIKRSIIWLWRSSLIVKIMMFVIIASIGWFGWTKFISQNSQSVTYQTSQVEKGNLVFSVTASGTVSQGSNVSITTQATGIVNTVYVKDGYTVTTGQKIADITLDVASQQKQTAALASYQQATNSLASAKNTLNTLQSTLFTANQKLINDAVARDLESSDPTYIQENADWLAAEGSYKNQQGVIAAAETSASSAWLSYSQLSPTITSPTSGIVSGLTITPGYAITNTSNSSTTTTTSTSLGTITLAQGTPQISVNLTESDVIKVKPGQKVTITVDALEGKTFTGKVMAVNTNGSVSSGVSSYPTTIAFDTEVETIYPNMAVNAIIITDVKNDLLLVPIAAVQTANGSSTVRVMKNNQPASVDVEIGRSNDTQVEVISGLNEGDTVVTGQSATSTSSQTTTSPFGNTRGGVGGFGGGGVVRINRN